MWGDGASMIRGPWKSRSSEGNGESDGGDGHNDDGTGSENEDAMDSRPEGAQATPVTQPMNYSGSRSSLVIEEDDSPEEEETDDGEETETQQEGDHEENLGELTNAMGSLSLVPPTIQFGRGAKRGGFSHHGRGATPDQRYGDDPEGRGYSRGGRRGRGRGRGGPRGGGNRRQDQQQPFQSQNTVAQPTARLTRPPAPPRGLGGNRRSGFPSRGNIPGRGLPMRGGIGGK